MGNGNKAKLDNLIGFHVLLTPHGERERQVPAAGGRSRGTPNPSWGTGTAPRLKLFDVLEDLLTPHGERELTKSDPKTAGLLPPNPSWGTGTSDDDEYKRAWEAS